MMPERVVLHRFKGWRKPENTVVVARPSRWGNPFKVEGASVVGLSWYDVRARFGRRPMVYDADGVASIYVSCSDREAAVDHAVDLFRRLCTVMHRDEPDAFERWIAPLRGKNLACWCKIGDRCHVNVLLELANASVGEGNTP